LGSEGFREGDYRGGGSGVGPVRGLYPGALKSKHSTHRFSRDDDDYVFYLFNKTETKFRRRNKKNSPTLYTIPVYLLLQGVGEKSNTSGLKSPVEPFRRRFSKKHLPALLSNLLFEVGT